MPCQAAQEMLRAVEMAQPDGYHAYIDGLLFESTSNVFTVGAFNGILLGAAESSQPSLDFRTVLAESAVKYLHRTIREGADELVLRLHERAVSFLCGPRETIVPMAAGTRFPAFRKFMPKGTYRMDARLEDIRSALTAVITPARDVHAVALAPSAGDLRFSVGESSAVISCFGALPEMKVSAEDLRAIMRSLETERVEFLCDGPTSPLAIRPMSGRTAVYLMSPTTK
jgi:DNA polymerase III sliding clamp (beta) subunit (PCNA family)